MITTKDELRQAVRLERSLYIGSDKFSELRLALLSDHDYLIWKFVKALRYTEYYYNKNNRLLYWIFQRKKNKLGSRLGLTMWHNTIDVGLKIWHYGSVIVNGHATIGKNCQFHGNNCVGNKGGNSNEAPTIGDNVEIGIGACVIGNITIADNVRIGANAVVTQSCLHKGATLVGIPAREISR